MRPTHRSHGPLRVLGSPPVTFALLLTFVVVLVAATAAGLRPGAAPAAARIFDSWVAFLGPVPLPGMRLLAVVSVVHLAFALPRTAGRRSPGLLAAHAGLLLLLTAGLATLVGGMARESFVVLRQGETAASAFDPRAWDLVLEPRGLAVPLERLREGAPVPGEPLIVVERSYANSRALVGPAGDELASLAPLRADADPTANRPGVILAPARDRAGRVVWPGRPTRIVTAGGPVSASLARREIPLPVSLTLASMQLSHYPQSAILSSLTAEVLVQGRGQARQARIGLGRPLRVAGLVVSVSSRRTDESGATALALRVSRNPLRPALYAGLALILLGVAGHFLGRAGRLVALLASCLAAPGSASALDGLPYDALGRVAVLSEGRLMPLETYARLSLREISGSAVLGGEPAVAWMARVLFAPGSALDDPLFVVRSRGARARLGLRAGGSVRLSYAELAPQQQRLQDLADRLEGRGNLAPAEAELVALKRRMVLFTRLVSASDHMRPHADFAVAPGEVSSRLGLSPGIHSLREIAAVREKLAGPWSSRSAAGVAGGLSAALDRWAADYGSLVPLLIPLASGTWVHPVVALASGSDAGAAASFAAAADAYNASDWPAMRVALESTARAVTAAAGGPDRFRAVRAEVLFNSLRLFAVAVGLSALGLAVLVLGKQKGPAAAAAALALASIACGGGLVLTVLVTSRPAVGTLAGTFAIASFVLSLAGLVGYAARRRPLALGLGCAAGLALGLISRGLAAAADELAVLPGLAASRGWLLAHVGVTVLGYAAALAAAGLAHVALARRLLRAEEPVRLGRLYARLRVALTTALLLIGAGTLAGCVWAEGAWGRLWSWDLKENATLVVILWIAATLQAARARLLPPQGVAAAAAGLSLAVGFSWIGVNAAGAGLHPYGQAAGAGPAFAAAAALETAFLAAALVVPPLRSRRSPGGDQVWRRPGG